METDQIISKIVDIPREFVRLKNISVYQLVLDSGYPEHRLHVKLSGVMTELERKKERIQDWINYSEDKRASSGWFITKIDEDQVYQVGFYDKSEGYSDQELYSDRIEACAAFILHELESISSG